MPVRLMFQRMLGLWAVVLALSCCPGCRVFVQNRYAIFGFDSLRTESEDHARVWSLVPLVGVVVISAAMGAVGFWLGPRLYRGWWGGFPTTASQRDPLADPLGPAAGDVGGGDGQVL
jgi:hypothetical protein